MQDLRSRSSPYLLPGQLRMGQAVAPLATQVVLLAAALVVALVISPCIGLLLYLDQRNVLSSPEHA